MSYAKIVILVALTVGLCGCAGGYQAQQFAKEKQACAELGLDPATPAFAQCAGNLDATMFALDHPNS